MRNRVLLPFLILLLGFCFTLLVYYYFDKLTYGQDHLRFNSSVQEIQDQVRLRIATSTALLRAGSPVEHQRQPQPQDRAEARFALTQSDDLP